VSWNKDKEFKLLITTDMHADSKSHDIPVLHNLCIKVLRLVERWSGGHTASASESWRVGLETLSKKEPKLLI
jgi:hypothetical protein